MPHNTDYLTYTSSASSVSGGRADLTETFILSARPQITSVRGASRSHTMLGLGAGDFLFDITGPRMTAGNDGSFYVGGYMYHTDNLSVYLSASPDVYTTYLSATTSFDLFSTYKYLSALYPAFTAFQIPELEWLFAEDLEAPFRNNPYNRPINMGYQVVNPTTMIVNVSAVPLTVERGQINIIIANKAGYTTLDMDLSGRVITPVDESPSITIDPDPEHMDDTYTQQILNLFWHPGSVGGTTDVNIDFEIQIFEVSDNTNRNWVRTVIDYTDSITVPQITARVGQLFASLTLNLTPGSESTAYYVMRGSHNGGEYLDLFNLEQSALGSNQHYITQAADADTYADGNDTNIVTDDDVTLGTGFPVPRYSKAAAIIYEASIRGGNSVNEWTEFQVDHTPGDPTWMWFRLSSTLP